MTGLICYKSVIYEISLIGFQVAPGVGQFGGFKSNANWNMWNDDVVQTPEDFNALLSSWN